MKQAIESNPNIKHHLDDNFPSVFLPAEHTPGQSGRFYKMDLTKSLSENLKGVLIVEHPTFYVSLDQNYPLVGDSTALVTKPAVKIETDSASSSSEDEGPSSSKKTRLTFFELSDAELSD